MFGYVDTANDQMDLLDAVYFSVETLATVGYGDFAFDAQPGYLRIVAILVADHDRCADGHPVRAGHRIPCQPPVGCDLRLAACDGNDQPCGRGGARFAGVAVVERLVAMGQQVVVVERDPNNRHIGGARALAVPVIAKTRPRRRPWSRQTCRPPPRWRS